MDERNSLLHSVCNLTSDYRYGEIDPPTPEQVDRWLCQFDAAVQLPIITELEHVLRRTYFSKASVESFLVGLVSPCKLVNNDPKNFWRTSGILNIQQRGRSQRDMLAIFDKLLSDRCGFSISECKPTSGRFIYLDDGQFTGFHAINDLVAWLPQAPNTCRIIILSVVQYAGSILLIQQKLVAEASRLGKQVVIEPWRCVSMENRRAYRNQSDVLWPCRLPDEPEVDQYVQGLIAAGHAPVLRTACATGSELFSSEAGRDVLEQEFLKAGVRIRRECPNLKEYQRPLGNSILKTLGFGSMVVTYRNCPNNSPLALWAGDPWYPLFRRRTN